MRKTVTTLMVSTILIAQPVMAIGLGSIGDLAKTVMKGRSVLKKGEQKCGSSLALNPSEKLTVESALAAVRKAIPLSEFTALDSAAETEAANDAKSVTFCDETKKKKKGLLGKIGKAGKSILAGKIGL